MLAVTKPTSTRSPAMFSVGEDVEADALFKRGWTVSAIARHLGRDRKTVRSYLIGRADTGRPPCRPIRTRSTSTGPTWPPGSSTTRTCGPRRSSTRWWPSGYRSCVPELRPPDPPGRAAPALRGLLRGQGPRDHRDRPSRRRGDPVGLVRAAATPRGAGRPMCCSARCRTRDAPRGAGRVDGPGPPRSSAMDAVLRRLGGHRPQVAHRPPGAR